MKERKTQGPIINKIEVDEKTKEPIIVQIPESELACEAVCDFEKENQIKKADFFEEAKSARSVGKQMIMNGLGLTTLQNQQINTRRRVFKLIVTLVFVVFVVGVLIFTFYKDFFGRSDPMPTWKGLLIMLAERWKYFACGIFALFLVYLLKALKLTILCKTLSGKFKFKTCFETAIIGQYYNYITPLAVGGQPFEIYHLSKHGVHGGVASSLPIATYVLNQFSFVILGIACLIMFRFNTLEMSDTLYYSFPTAFTVMAIIGVCCCFITPFLVVLFCLLPRVGAMLVKFVMHLGNKLKIIKDPKKTTYKTIKNIVHNAQCLKNICKRPIPTLLCFILSFGEHIASASIAYFALKTFGYGISFTSLAALPEIILEWSQILQFTMMLTFTITFIPTPGNAGAADLSFYILFSASLAAGLAFPSMMLWRLMSFYSFIFIGFMFATIRKRVDRKKAKLNI